MIRISYIRLRNDYYFQWRILFERTGRLSYSLEVTIAVFLMGNTITWIANSTDNTKEVCETRKVLAYSLRRDDSSKKHLGTTPNKKCLGYTNKNKKVYK